MTHFVRDIEGICPISVYVDFKSITPENKIEIFKEQVADIFAKYFNTFDVDIESFDEDGVDLDVSLNLTGQLEYWSGDLENPPEEDVRWSEDYESILPKVKEEIKKLNNCDYVSLYDGDIDEIVIDYD